MADDETTGDLPYEPEPAASPRCTLPVVAIGASAGGVQALQTLMPSFQRDQQQAYVIILHSDPKHRSHLAEVLRVHSELTFVDVDRPLTVEPDTVYVAHAGHPVEMHGAELRPVDGQPQRTSSIDAFFRSMAAACGPASIAVLLSGAGSDGSLGIKDIKAEGGLVIVQEPSSASHDSLLRSAIATGLVDYVLPLEEIPERIAAFIRHPYVRAATRGEEPEAEEVVLQQILDLLRNQAQHDYDGYKQGTLIRRIQRRMGLRQIESAGAYLLMLRDDPDELAALHEDLLICVTHFFRDAAAWESLRTTALAPLAARRAGGDGPLRAWVPGCATGEEAYTLAILLAEQRRLAKQPFSFTIFASDVHRGALEQARTGLFSGSIAQDVSDERLERYFLRENGGYRVKPEIREAIVFAQQNVLADPPFSRLDLVTCRNLLIYLKPEAQRRLLALFHFTLRDGGYLFLGNSETIGADTDLWRTASRATRIYHRIGPTRLDRVEFPTASRLRPVTSASPAQPAGAGLEAAASELLLKRFAPACVLINHNFQILYLRGATDRFLSQPQGPMTTDLMAWTTVPLRAKIRGALHKSSRFGERQVIEGITLPDADGRLRVVIEHLTEPPELAGLLLLSFADEPAAPGAGEPPATAGFDDHTALRHLERELLTTKEDLQSSIEQLEASNQEFEAANEEVTSINEELQSTNEELQTSKEELQSLNEELSTVNVQLELKVRELERANDDLSNLLTSTQTPTIFLDLELGVKWFTSPTSDLVPLIDSDVGRPIADLVQRIDHPDLVPEARAVIETLQPRQGEVESQSGRWYIRRIQPYRTSDHRIEGVVVSFIDITARKEAERGLRRLANVVLESSDAITVQDFDRTIQEWNLAAQRMYGYTADEAVGMCSDALAAEDERAAWRDCFEQVRGGRSPQRREFGRLAKDGRRLQVMVAMSALSGDNSEPGAVTTTEHDLTPEREFEARLHQSALDLADEVGARTQLVALQQGDAAYSAATVDEAVQNTLEHLCGRLAASHARAWVASGEEETLRPLRPWRSCDDSVPLPAELAARFDAAIPALAGGAGVVLLDCSDGRFPISAADARKAGAAELLLVQVRIRGERACLIALLLGELPPLPVAAISDALTQVAVQLGRAIERARNAEALRAMQGRLLLTEERERRAVAQDLHDELGQLLALAQIKLSGAKAEDEAIRDAAEMLRRANDVVRSMSVRLSVPLIPEAGLRAAFERLGEDFESEHGLAVTLGFKGPEPALDEDVLILLYRSVRELLLNVVKHAGVDHVEVRVDHGEAGALRVIVQDSGRGFDADEQVERPGFGILSIRDRLRYLGGECNVESNVGQGTRVTMILPLSPAEEDRGDYADSGDDR